MIIIIIVVFFFRQFELPIWIGMIIWENKIGMIRNDQLG